MPNNTYLTVIIILIVASLGAATFARFSQGLGSGESETAIVVDVSGSTRNICPSLKGEVAKALENSNHVVVYATGLKSTGNEPFRVASFEKASGSSFGIGRQKENRKRSEEFLSGLNTKCEQELSVLNDKSAIYRSIARVSTILQSKSCMESHSCRMHVVTDGLETVNGPIRKTLKSQKSKPVLNDLIINNPFIEVEFCGFAEGKRNVGLTNRLERGWKSVFKYPELVTFRPFCNVVQ